MRRWVVRSSCVLVIFAVHLQSVALAEGEDQGNTTPTPVMPWTPEYFRLQREAEFWRFHESMMRQLDEMQAQPARSQGKPLTWTLLPALVWLVFGVWIVFRVSRAAKKRRAEDLARDAEIAKLRQELDALKGQQDRPS